MTRVVALYGGTFNPPHMAHVMGTSHVLETENVQEVWWIPVHRHAFDEKQESASYSDRVAMCELATAGFGDRVRVSTIEAELPGRNRTIDTLTLLESRHPDLQFRLVIGADVFEESHLWKAFDELAERAPFIVLGRPGHVIPAPWTASTRLPDVSSRAIRTRIAGGEGAGDDVPASVADYIEAHQLYAAQGAP